MGNPTWAPVEIAYLGELVQRFGSRGNWDQIRTAMERRFGAVRPYRQLRLDVKWRQLCTKAQRKPPPPGKKSESALEVLLGTPRRVSENDAAAANRQRTDAAADPLLSLANVAAGLFKSGAAPSKDKQDYDVPGMVSSLLQAPCPSIPSAVIVPVAGRPHPHSRSLPDTSTARQDDASHLRQRTRPGQYVSESVLVAKDLVRSHGQHAARNRDSAPSPGARKRPRSVSPVPVAATTFGDAVRRSRPSWTSDERAQLEALVSIHGRNWALIARLMRERFDSGRDFTAQSVMMQFRRVNGLMKGRGVRSVDAERLAPPVVEAAPAASNEERQEQRDVKRLRLTLSPSNTTLPTIKEEVKHAETRRDENAEVLSARKDLQACAAENRPGPISMGLLERIPSLRSGNCAIQ